MDSSRGSARKILIAALVVLILALVGFFSYQNYLAPLRSTPTPVATAVAEVYEPDILSAEGKVIPRQSIELNFNTIGKVETVNVQEGNQVSAGQLLARLEGRLRQEEAVEAAKLELLSARQALDVLNENSDLALAQANQAVVDARHDVKNAQRALDSLYVPASESQIETAEAAVALSKKLLERAHKELTPLEKKPVSDPKRAAAQIAVFAAEQQYLATVRLLNSLNSKPGQADIERAEAALALAQAQLEKTEHEADVLSDGPDPDQVALAQARIDHAQAQLKAAQASLEDLELRSPFAGEIVSLDLKVGDVVNPSVPRVILADTTGWQVETVDLSETDVGRLQPGMQATVRLDAFPGREFPGHLQKISQIGKENRGLTTYTVTIDFETGEVPVRWQMTALVDFLLEP